MQAKSCPWLGNYSQVRLLQEEGNTNTTCKQTLHLCLKSSHAQRHKQKFYKKIPSKFHLQLSLASVTHKTTFHEQEVGFDSELCNC